MPDTEPMPETLDAEMQPREQHYVFAHRMLMDLAFSNPDHLFTMLSGPEKRRFLADVWDRVADFLSLDTTLSCEGLDAVVEGDLAIIRLPQPERVPEAYFVGIVRIPGRNYWLFRGKPTIAYYTLEYTFGDEDEEATVLGGWNQTPGGEPVHLNFGPGPRPELAAFRETILQYLSKR